MKRPENIILIIPDTGDTKELSELEELCFPPNEACSREMVKIRLEKMPELWLCAKDEKTGKLAGLICGYASSKAAIEDEMFTGTELYEPDGKNIMLLGVETHPDYRGRGIAGYMIEEYKTRMKSEKREKLILTCHDYLIPFYEKFGFKNAVRSESKWGGEIWYDMECVL